MSEQQWKLVPENPALALDMGWAYLDAAREAEPNKEWSFSHAGYRAMLAAAPQPPALCHGCMQEANDPRHWDEAGKCKQVQPPALGGEPEVLGYSVKGNRYAIRLTKGELLELYEGYSGDALIELVDRTHLIRLQAEVERLTTENGKIRAINNLLDGINERAHDQIRRMIANVDQELACREDIDENDQDHDQIMREMRALVPGIESPVTQSCAAKHGGHECNAARADGSLFCAQHRSVDGRQRMGSEAITNEGLAFMMQRDGEQQ